MKFIRVLKSSKWSVEKINENDWTIKSPDGMYKDENGKEYHFKTKEDALEELDYLRAEHKFDKKSKLGFFAEPENEVEQMVLDIADEIADKSFDALEKNEWKGWSTEEEHKKGIEIVKKAIAPIVEKYRTELEDEEVFNMLYDHNEDNNYHLENIALKDLLNLD